MSTVKPILSPEDKILKIGLYSSSLLSKNHIGVSRMIRSHLDVLQSHLGEKCEFYILSRISGVTRTSLFVTLPSDEFFREYDKGATTSHTSLKVYKNTTPLINSLFQSAVRKFSNKLRLNKISNLIKKVRKKLINKVALPEKLQLRQPPKWEFLNFKLDVLIMAEPWDGTWVYPIEDYAHKVVMIIHDLVPNLLVSDHNDRNKYFAFYKKNYHIDDNTRVFADQHFLGFYHGLMKADGVVCISDCTKRDLIELFPEYRDKACMTVYPTWNQSFMPLSQYEREKVEICDELKAVRLDFSKPIVFAINVLDSRKNGLLLVKAFALLVERQAITSDVQLVICSHARCSNEYLINFLSIAKDVNMTWVQNLSDKAMCKLLNLATVFAFPTLYEGFGIPVLEAMICKTLVVTSDSSSIPEVTNGNCLFCDPTSVESIASSILEALEMTKETKEELINKAFAYASYNFSQEQVYSSYMKLFSKIGINI